MRTLIITLFLFSNLTLTAQTWLNDIEDAKQIATENNQRIILVFQGSDWCAPCIKLENEIWSSDTFKDYANKNFTLIKADFPRKKKNSLPPELQQKNKMLMEQFNQQGYFPLVVVLDHKGEILGKTGYKKISPEAYIELLASY